MSTGRYGVYELRQYTLHPGTREKFVRLFETHLLDTQDAVGMRVLGQFHDAQRPDAFVWIRSFAGMDQRRDALNAFYYGPVWAAHRNAANAMMIDSDDVLLLEPIDGGPALAEHVAPRPPLGAAAAGSAAIDVTICPVRREDNWRCLEQLAQLQQRAGGAPLPALQTLHAVNTFPQLPVHEDRNVVVGLARHADPERAGRLRAQPAYRAALAELERLTTAPVHQLRLTPTPRSALR
jgi:hypothetical protein